MAKNGLVKGKPCCWTRRWARRRRAVASPQTVYVAAATFFPQKNVSWETLPLNIHIRRLLKTCPWSPFILLLFRTHEVERVGRWDRHLPLYSPDTEYGHCKFQRSGGLLCSLFEAQGTKPKVNPTLGSPRLSFTLPLKSY